MFDHRKRGELGGSHVGSCLGQADHQEGQLGSKIMIKVRHIEGSGAMTQRKLGSCDPAQPQAKRFYQTGRE